MGFGFRADRYFIDFEKTKIIEWKEIELFEEEEE